ncbi:hypothetical protein COU60_02165 [Candidatus Pacearchaeota archaeon CG10_big_fil_rev_8_21_14_0_10_34_76]|nr:MAG: hypothetical protein COU60_02165 [Candidatus Pacearchaeota archaeon CG10_big_fil_rev_8_21_14_0_10_34_76]
MDIYKHNWTRLQAEIFSLLCLKAERRLSQREIAKLLKVSPTAISNSLSILEKDNLIKIEKVKNINFVMFNRDEKKARELKQLENLKNIYLSGLLDYLEQELAGGTMVLFGSYAIGEDTENSDIDIAVIGRKEKELNIENFEKVFEKEINIQFYESWKKIHINLRNNILNGIILSGSVEL